MAFLILVIGDLHIPDRALDIPAKVRYESNIYPPSLTTIANHFQS
jgi:hypothetical protein